MVENGFAGTEESSPERFISAIPSVKSEFSSGFEGSITSIECPARCLTGSLSSIRGSIIDIKGLLLLLSKVAAEVTAGTVLEGSRSKIKSLPMLLLLPTSEIMLEVVVFLVEISFNPKASAEEVFSSESSLTILKIEGVEGLIGLAKRVDVNVVDAVIFVGAEVVSCVVALINGADAGVDAALALLLALSINV